MGPRLGFCNLFIGFWHPGEPHWPHEGIPLRSLSITYKNKERALSKLVSIIYENKGRALGRELVSKYNKYIRIKKGLPGRY